MADPRFFERRGPFSLQELASTLGGKLDTGPDLDPDCQFHDVAPLELARPDELSSLHGKRFADMLRGTRAGACLVAPDADAAAPSSTRLIHVEQPYLAYIRVANPFHPEPALEPGVEAQAVVDASARIGQPGFGFVPGAIGLQRVPRLGRVVIDDDVDIGANATIDRPMAGDTMIGAGSIIDNMVQIAHNVTLGRGCIIVAQAGVSGSTRLEDHVVLGGRWA